MVKLALFLVLSFVAVMANATTASSISKAKPASEKRGYWWGEDPPVEHEEEEFPILSAPPPEEELLKMHPQQIEKLITDYRQFALWKMTEEHVEWYYRLQDFARRRSRAFVGATEQVMLAQSELNMNAVYPSNVAGQNTRASERDKQIRNRLAKEGQKSALILFTRPNCPYCEDQRNTLRYFQQKHAGWQVREIDVQANPQIGQKFGVTTVPVTAVIFRGSDNWAPIAVGVESVPKVEEGIYRAVRRLRGETTIEQFMMMEQDSGGPLDPRRALQ